MLRKKAMKLIVTFHTTADAMAMESACREGKVPGRLIPVPRSISAGCGLSWCAEESQEEQLKEVLKKIGVDSEGIHHCLI